MVAVQYNPFSPDTHANPYPLYKQLRDTDPVHRAEMMDAVVLTRYEDVVAVLKDNERFSADRRQSRNRLVQAAMQGVADERGPLGRANTMLGSDPPEHTRLRGLVSKAFTPRVVAGMRTHIQEIVDELIDAVENNGRMDMIWDLAYPLPVIVIAEMLGVPPDQRDTFKRWSDAIVATLGGPMVSPETAGRGREAAEEMAAYFHDVIAERRRAPQEDLISLLLGAEERGDVLSEEELLATCVLLLAAGNETTTNLIGNGTLALLRNSAQYELLQRDPSLVESAVEEMLRYDGPVQGTARVAKTDLEIDGHAVKEGDLCMCLLGAANHDPAVFDRPDELDITRTENRHIAFGFGIHFCLGAPLARAEAQIAFSTLLRRLPPLRLETEAVEWGGTFILRGLKKLHVAWS